MLDRFKSIFSSLPSLGSLSKLWPFGNCDEDGEHMNTGGGISPHGSSRESSESADLHEGGVDSYDERQGGGRDDSTASQE